MHEQVSTQFPSEWVRRKRRDNFHVTVVGTIGSRTAYHWVVVVTSGTNFHQQIVELDFVYPSEAIHLYWDQGEIFESFPDARRHACGVLAAMQLSIGVVVRSWLGGPVLHACMPSAMFQACSCFIWARTALVAQPILPIASCGLGGQHARGC